MCIEQERGGRRAAMGLDDVENLAGSPMDPDAEDAELLVKLERALAICNKSSAYNVSDYAACGPVVAALLLKMK